MASGRAPLGPQRPPPAGEQGEFQGGALKGGPKRWSGRGPKPARHIPWPEIFKHHISLIEGHIKMTDMVRKHTVEGTNNHKTICDIVARTREMLHQSKNISRSFVPPANALQQVPLGSGSESMYPGYSPGDVEYGKAAKEYGQYAAEAKKKGIDVNPEGLDYEIGQSKRRKREAFAQTRAANRPNDGEGGNGTGLGSDNGFNGTASEQQAVNGTTDAAETAEATSPNFKPMFVIDTKPTPVNLPGMGVPPLNHEDIPEPVKIDTFKEAKEERDADSLTDTESKGETAAQVTVEFEDISEEVDARMKAKEEKRKQKYEAKGQKKRKRESNDLTAPVDEVSAATDEAPTKLKKRTKDAKPDSTIVPSTSTKQPLDPNKTETLSEVTITKPKKKKAKLDDSAGSKKGNSNTTIFETPDTKPENKKTDKKAKAASEDPPRKENKKKRTATDEDVESAETAGKKKKAKTSSASAGEGEGDAVREKGKGKKKREDGDEGGKKKKVKTSS